LFPDLVVEFVFNKQDAAGGGICLTPIAKKTAACFQAAV
jgi:hypothetical protein